jgi:CRISPR-associated endonuclease/helicase Cas3
VPEILGQHHGFSPQLGGRRAEAEVFGGPLWQQERTALVDKLKQQLGMDWPKIESDAQARLVAGLTSVVDWIGSGQHFENPDEPWQAKINLALHESGFVPLTYQTGLSFAQIFGFTPRPVQEQFIKVVTGPGVYVLEAPMGLGKTEAALYAAYHLLQSGRVCGIYFALPTQLTSNKIYQRFNNFLERILAFGCPHRRALLLHGKAWLQQMEMGEEGRPGGAWFNQAKRGLLAPFAVGTIDQALMAAMNVKHGFVRAFGLAGKVVILDEVHTYDAYTGTLLDALVKLLRSLGCTVIILSATLNQKRRSQLLETPLSSSAYPLITAVTKEQIICELTVEPPADTRISITLQQDESRGVQAALDRASQGQQVLWIENTVNEAQQRYLDIAARACELGVSCGLLHSRFTVADRQRIEAQWVDLFGKPGWSIRHQQGRILVGTQVLEQSLDIDADFLVSRFAPTDMLLQRLGRLWRHAETPRTAEAACEAWLLAPNLEAAIESPISTFGASAFVYAPYVLCRSLAVWQPVQQLTLPGDIRHLIEASYANREEQGQMVRWLYELDHGTKGHYERKGRIALQQLARLGLAQEGKTLPESKAQTRYSESDVYEVLLLRGLHYDEDSQSTCLTLLNRQVLMLPTRQHQLTKMEWKTLAARLMQEIVVVRIQDAPLPPSREQLKKLGLGHCFYLGDPAWPEDESTLRLALVNDVGQLQGLYGALVHERYSLEYRDDLGYRMLKN